MLACRECPIHRLAIKEQRKLSICGSMKFETALLHERKSQRGLSVILDSWMTACTCLTLTAATAKDSLRIYLNMKLVAFGLGILCNCAAAFDSQPVTEYPSHATRVEQVLPYNNPAGKLNDAPRRCVAICVCIISSQ